MTGLQEVGVILAKKRCTAKTVDVDWCSKLLIDSDEGFLHVKLNVLNFSVVFLLAAEYLFTENIFFLNKKWKKMRDFWGLVQKRS